MTIDDLETVDSVEGQTPRSSFGERGIMGLALLALVGGLLIAGGNLIGKVVPSASPSTPPVARETATASPHPTPEPTPLVVVLGPEPLPTPTPEPSQEPQYSGWIRARGEVRTYVSPAIAGTAGAPLHDGEVAWAETDPNSGGWLRIQAGGGDFAYLEPAVADSGSIEQVPYQGGPYSGGVWSLTAGGNGFVAQVAPATAGNEGQPARVAYSTDGTRWRLTNLESRDFASVAWGPRGWLALSSRYDGERASLEIYGSQNGMGWGRLASAADGLAGSVVGNVAGSDAGYVVQTFSQALGAPTAVWSSRDGITWRTGDLPMIPSSRQLRIAGLPSGFYAWDPSGPAAGFFSSDGEHWLRVEGGPGGDASQVVQVGHRLVGIVHDGSATTSTRIFAGTVDGAAFAWDDPGGRHFGALAPTVGQAVIASDGEMAVIVAFDWATESILEWTSNDGLVWAPRPATGNIFGGAPATMVGGRAGFVLVGERPTLRGQNPIFWHRETPSGWRPEPSPIIAFVPDLPSSECGAPPHDAIDLQVMDLARVIACFGAAPITFTAWSVADGCCVGGEPGLFEPGWLGQPTAGLFLSPVNGPYTNAAVVSPSLASAIDPTWTGTRVRVTGHFDDPAAASCRWRPDASGQSWYPGPLDVINMCRSRFVVTALEVLPGA